MGLDELGSMGLDRVAGWTMDGMGCMDGYPWMAGME